MLSTQEGEVVRIPPIGCKARYAVSDPDPCITEFQPALGLLRRSTLQFEAIEKMLLDDAFPPGLHCTHA